MNTQTTIWTVMVTVAAMLFTASNASAQSSAYQRKKPKAAASTTANPAKAGEAAAKPTDSAVAGANAGAPASEGSEKLDIQQLEQKYWAPKDTDFSVVQNRTYTKAKKVAVSLLTGPIVNDPYNKGLTTALSVNYYIDERYGVELMYQRSSLSDSDAVGDFHNLPGGGVGPNYNRDTGFYGVGFNWVPFYAKMSFLGKKIIYFDMQITPFIGMTEVEQQSTVRKPSKTSFTYGFDVTQYFFFSQHWAVRANLHNRFYSADVLDQTTGAVDRSDDQTNTTMFLMGITYFW